MADPPSYPRTPDETGAEPRREPAVSRPRWTLIAFWVIAIAVLLVILILHLAGALGPGTNG